MIAWLLGRSGRPILIGAVILLLVVMVFLIGRCTKDDRSDELEAQVEQTDRSGKAIANAAEMAIDTIGDRVATEATIDQAVRHTIGRIDEAPDLNAVRYAVIASLCQQYEHRNDPACSTAAENRQ